MTYFTVNIYFGETTEYYCGLRNIKSNQYSTNFDNALQFDNKVEAEEIAKDIQEAFPNTTVRVEEVPEIEIDEDAE